MTASAYVDHLIDEDVQIVLVDDQSEGLHSTKSVIDRPGYRVHEARTESEALQCLREQNCALVILALNMPNLRGFEIASKIRDISENKDLPMIFVASREAGNAISQVYELGAADIVFSPFDRRLLRSKVESFAKLFRAHRQIERQSTLLREQAQESLRSVVANTPVVFWSIDQNGIFKFSEGKALEKLNLRPGAAVGRSDYDMFAGTEAIGHIKSALSGKEHWGTVQVADAWFETLYSPVRNVAGEVQGVSGISTDITERKRAEELQLLDSERFRLLAESMPQIVWTARPDGVVDYYNQRAVEYVGQEIYDNWNSIIHPADCPEALRRWKCAVENGVEYEVEYRLKRRSDNHYRWHLGRALPLRDTSGAILRWLGTCTDIHEQKIAEERAREAELKLKLTLQLAQTGTWTWDVASQRASWDETNAHLHGIESNAFTGTLEEYKSLIHPEDYEELQVNVPQLLSGQGDFFAEYRCFRPNGKVRWLRSKGRCVYDDHGNPVRIMGTTTDIHSDKLADERLVSEQHLLKEAVNSREEFISIASHELKTPLTTLKLQLQLAQQSFMGKLKKDLKPDHMLKFFDVCSNQTDKLIGLVENLLTVTRVRSGQLLLRPVRLDLAALAQAVGDRMSPQFRAASISFSIDSGGETFVICDRFWTEQVIVNLLTNAIKYGAKKPVSLTVRVGKKTASMSVSDQGYGIPKDKQRRIFERFARGGDDASKNISGLGLGLYIVGRVLALQQGSIRVESELGKGSSFIVELPLA